MIYCLKIVLCLTTDIPKITDSFLQANRNCELNCAYVAIKNVCYKGFLTVLIKIP